VEGSAFPVAANLLGSSRRIELALGRPAAEVGSELARALPDLQRPGWPALWRRLPGAARPLPGSRFRSGSDGPSHPHLLAEGRRAVHHLAPGPHPAPANRNPESGHLPPPAA
jgi:hypothetical protein